MWSNVKQYTSKQLLERVESVGGTIKNKGTYRLIGVQSQEDSPNLFDDKFYLFDGDKFQMVTTGTTNSGATALKYFDKYDLTGAAVLKTDEDYDALLRPGKHKGRMDALRQVKPIKYYRDSDKDLKAEQTGPLHTGIIYVNFHGIDYNPMSNKIGTQIGGWSFGCQVANIMSHYRMIIKETHARGKDVDYTILKEW